MPRKKIEEMDASPEPVVETKPDAVVVSTQDTTTRKVKLDLEVDTSVKAVSYTHLRAHET